MSRAGHGARAAALAAAVLTLVPGLSSAQGSVEDRLARLERLVNTNTLVELLERVDRLQRELQGLRGEIELQTHTLSQLKQRQRDLYLDVDRRLQQVEVTGGGGARPAAVAGAGAAAPPPPAAAGTPPATTPATSPPVTTVAAVNPATAPAPMAAAADPVREQSAYQEAFNLLKAGRYGPAATAFQGFLAEYPRGQYSDNAQYWLGEAYYVTRQFDPALVEFQKLVTSFPESPKLTHALLKIGYIQDELGKKDEAKRVLTDLMTQHPNTTAGRLARERLQRMRAAKP